MGNMLNRRSFLTSAGVSVAALTLPGCEAFKRVGRRPVASKPNIIFIMADDLGYEELGCYGQRKIKTPNVDRLAAAGMRFTQYYTGSAVCAGPLHADDRQAWWTCLRAR